MPGTKAQPEQGLHKVLDKGFLKLIEFMGGDQRAVESARVPLSVILPMYSFAAGAAPINLALSLAAMSEAQWVPWKFGFVSLTEEEPGTKFFVGSSIAEEICRRLRLTPLSKINAFTCSPFSAKSFHIFRIPSSLNQKSFITGVVLTATVGGIVSDSMTPPPQ